MSVESKNKEVMRAFNTSINLRQLIRDSKITINELSKRTGLSNYKVGEYSAGRLMPSDPEVVSLFAKALGCTVEYLTRIELDPFSDFTEDELYKGE